MAFFGLGTVFDSLTSSARTGTRENPVVAIYDGGKFTRDDISNLTRNHFYTRNFLNELRNLGVEKRGDQFVELVRPIVPLQDGQQEYKDEQIINRMLMAEKARSEGLAVSDSMVDQYFFGTYGVLDGDGMSNRDLELLNRSVNNGQVSMAAIRRHLKMELLSQQMTLLSYSGIPRVPSPLESVDFYAKVNKKIQCEIFPVSIKEYIDNNSSPPESEIRSLYEKGKFSLKDPAGKRPGFKLPRRVKLQYLVGDYQDFLDKATEGLSDEEIQAKYDELIAQESDLVMEIAIDENEGDDDMPAINLEGDDSSQSGEEEAAPKPTEPSEPSTSGETAEPDSDDQSYRVGPTDSKFVLVSMPAQDGEGAVEVPVAEPAGADEVADAADAGEAVADQVEDAVDAAADEVEAAVTEAVDGTPDDTTDETPAVTSETEATDAVAMEEPASAASETDSAGETDSDGSSEPVQMSGTPADSEAKDATAATENSPATTEGDDVGGIGDMKDVDVGPMLADDEGVTKRAKPLEEVADLIRRQLKGQEASEALSLAIKTAESEVENYFTQRLQWEVNGKERNRPEPEMPDFQAIADRNGLRLAETELLDNEGLMKTELGGVYKIFTVQNRNIPVPMADVIFDQFGQLDEYGASSTDNRFTGKSYVYWPTELADSEVPKLEQCKEQIIEYWREQQAIESATKAAEGIAAKVGKDKKLSEIDPAKTIQTGEFTWFQPRGQRAVLSTPIGVDSPSEKFMETAFSLDQGEAGVALNGSGDTIFVIQSESPKISMAEVGDDYLKNQLFRFQRLPPDVGLISGHYFRQKTLDWNQEYVDSIGFEMME